MSQRPSTNRCTKLDLAFEDLGVQPLKNIEHPIRIYRGGAGALPAGPCGVALSSRSHRPVQGRRPSSAFPTERNETVQCLQTAFCRGSAHRRGVRHARACSANRADPGGTRAAPHRSPRLAARPAPVGPISNLIMAVLGGAERGRWRVPEHCTAVAIMGGCVLDLRAAQLRPGHHHHHSDDHGRRGGDCAAQRPRGDARCPLWGAGPTTCVRRTAARRAGYSSRRSADGRRRGANQGAVAHETPVQTA